MPKSVLPRARGPPRPGSTIFETFNAQNAEICTPPRPCPPPPPEAKARARGSTNPWTPCKFGKTFTSCHPHLRWSHSSPFRQHWSHTALVSGKSDDETACCSPIPQTFEALVRLPHNLFDVLAALLWQPHELVDVLGAFLWFQPSLPGKG